MAESTWSTLEAPILEAIATLEGIRGTTADLIAAHTGLETETCLKTLQSLIEADYVAGDIAKYMGGAGRIRNVRLLERGKVQIGQWPSDNDLYSDLIELLDRQIQAAEKADKKKLEGLREAVVKAGPGVAITLGKAWLDHIMRSRT